MSAKEALEYLANEFVGRFGCDAESCAEREKTHAAFVALTDALGLPPMACKSGYCQPEERTS